MDWKGWASHSRHCMPLWPKQMETVVWLHFPRHMAAQQSAAFLLMQPARAGRLKVCADLLLWQKLGPASSLQKSNHLSVVNPEECVCLLKLSCCCTGKPCPLRQQVSSVCHRAEANLYPKPSSGNVSGGTSAGPYWFPRFPCGKNMDLLIALMPKSVARNWRHVVCYRVESRVQLNALSRLGKWINLIWTSLWFWSEP